MKSQLVICLIACVLGTSWSAPSCDGPIQQFHQCQEQIRRTRETERKSKMDAARPLINKCFTDNGCQAPAEEGHQPNADAEKRQHCNKDLNLAIRGKVEACVRRTSSSFSFPADNHQEEHREGDMMKFKGGKVEKACGGSADKAKLVKACIKTNAGGMQLSEQEKKARFDHNCQQKTQCDNALGPCRPQLDQLRQSICQCQQQVRTDVAVTAMRQSTASCNGLQENNKGPKKQQRSCDNVQQKDACQQGYDAWKASHQQNHQNGPHGGPGGH